MDIVFIIISSSSSRSGSSSYKIIDGSLFIDVKIEGRKEGWMEEGREENMEGREKRMEGRKE